VQALTRGGYHSTLAVGIAASEGRFVERARDEGCRLVDVPSLGREPRPVRDLRALATLVRLIRRERVAIVHTHTSKAGFIGRLAGRLAGVPAIIHQPHGHIFYAYYGPSRTVLYVTLERIAARWSDRLVMLTDRGIEEHLAVGIGRRSQFVTVPSGVPTDELRARARGRAEARRALGLSTHAFVVAAVGRLVPVKGFDILVRALPALVRVVPDAQVIVAGEGPEGQRLTELAERLGVPGHVRLLGGDTDVIEILAAADVLAAPSRNEGMGRALVESMALGVPVVAAAVGGIPSVVNDDVGRLIPADDASALAAALIELGGDSRLRAKLADAARRRADDFSTSVAEARMLEMYDALVREKGLA
jgi:glycosyltransferase involved in cell wall biosynthesis